ncbi:hypothetical protein [Nonomuraea fuscirosea]|uniref:hypothetical protein n=1 Tax=Nonomuraea fuscirosea TaxID=1291556 RepID=UPI0033F3D178
MNHEQEELAQARRTLAHREPAGPAPVPELLRRGRRARRTRAVVSALSGLALAAAAVLVVVGIGPDVSPAGTVPVASASPTPDGAPRSATLIPLQYTFPAGQSYTIGLTTTGEFYKADTFDTTPHVVVRGTDEYHQIQFGHRVMFVRSEDVVVTQA